MAKKRRRDRVEPPEPVEPTRFGVESEPWARYTGAGALLRVVTAMVYRRKYGPRPELPPVATVFVIALGWGLLIGLVWWLVALTFDRV